MSEHWFSLWIPAFLLTILVETPVVVLLTRRRIGWGAALALGVALQAVTHPLFWLTWERWQRFFFSHYLASTAVFEAVIFLAEAALIAWVVPRRERSSRRHAVWAVGVSTLANSASLLLGILKSYW